LGEITSILCGSASKPFLKNVQKVGVFVNASFDFILEKIKTFDLQAVQLHGQETPEICAQLKPLNNGNQSLLNQRSF
jgi:phosphoribosylanthranilate isomerase